MYKTHLITALVFAAAIGSGIVGGIFYAFSSFVMAALARIPPAQGVAAMKSINVSVINASFMIAFLGTGVLCLVLGVGALVLWNEPGSRIALIASVVYLAGNIGVTMVFNVPLNDQLAAAADPAKAVEFWPHYLSAWNVWNDIRTGAAILSAVLFTATLCRIS